MLHTLLVTATDLERWADLLEGKSTFPELLRRLIIVSSGELSHVSFSSAEGVQLGGWDGISTAGQPTPFVPGGTSGWELGTNQDRRGKADSDYEKRTVEPLGLVPSDAAFIFCTPRRWGSKDGWMTGRRAEGRWREVRVYDADDLATWLSTAPAVHIWLSMRLHKRPAGVTDLEGFWQDWAGVITPPVPDGLLLAGRVKTTELLHSWLTNPTSSFSLVADSRKEAVAILAAATLALPEAERVAVLARAVVVETLPLWQELTATTESLLLIPLFRDDEAIASAQRHGHQVFVALDHTDVKAKAHLPLRIMRDDAARVLLAHGFPSGQVYILAGVARRSMAAFRRHRTLRPIGATAPGWAIASYAPVLLAAALVGGWNENEREAAGDQDAIAELAARPYDQVRQELTHLANVSEPPVRLVGSTWYVVDKADVWALMGRFLTPKLLDRFTGVVQRILGSSLPRYELPVNQQFWAELHGKRALTSKLLRQQVADTLAFLGADEEAAPAVSSLVNRAVRDLLQQANRQPTVWLSLAYLLPQLAEASPDAFLEGVAAGLKGDLPPILLLFEERPDLFYKTAHYPGLLWALELLAWSPAYLGYAARLLAILTQLDPGGTLTNRPKRSLAAVFLPLLPQTRATASERFDVLDGLRHTHPVPAWSLLLSLLSNRITHVGARTPTWREWGSVGGLKTVIPTQAVADFKAIAERVVHDVGVDPDRWITLLPNLPNLDVDHLPTALQKLRQLTKAVLTEEQRGLLVSALRKLIHYRRSRERDDHNLSTDDVNELENSYQALLSEDYVQRYGWLFEFRPHLLSGNSDRRNEGEKEYRETVTRRQREVLNILLASVGLSGILALIAWVEAPGKLGERLSERTDISSEQKDELLTRYLGSTEGAEWQFAHDFAIGYRLTQAAPWEWASAQVHRYKDIWTPLQQAAWLDTYPANPSTWQLAADLGADTEQQYWARISPYWVNVTDVPVAFANFLRYDRSLAAVQLAHLNQQVELPVDALTTALEAALYKNVADEPHVRLDADDFAELLARLADTPDVEQVRIARLEFDLLPAQYERRLTAKSLYRALCTSPAFFAQLVQLCSFSDDHSDPPSTDYERRANADKLLHGWPTVPGHNAADKTFDTKVLLEWVQAARQEVATISRTKRGEQLIGEMFSAAPIGNDGLWPHEAVRDAIEDAASDDMEFGFEVGTTNNHSFTVRGLYDGGTQEREMAAGFTSAAGGMALHWPRMAAVLRRLAASYHRDASREDDEANLEHDLGL